PTLDVLGAVCLLLVWLTFGSPHYQGRIFVMALAESVFFAVGAWLSWQAKPRGFGSRFLTAAFLAGAAVAIWRIATLSAGNGGSDEAFDRDLVQQVYLGMFSLGVLALSIGFILLANERLRVELEFMATRDPLTGVLNRRAFFARAGIEWARATRARRPLAVIVSDIDFFKKVNDTHGHHIGDQVIKDFARRAQSLLRMPDILARFGGEEFVILLPDTDLAHACQVAERIRRELEIPRDPTLPRYTASLGVAATQWQAGDAADIEALIAAADAALYRAKQGGRNRVEH
ncbi:MAG: GGDEF domain-containing protein, partial [Rhodocyclaceae bacterium]|nr:GGDEF domain-containing protein [Rhodocyclaceae bacterium]